MQPTNNFNHHNNGDGLGKAVMIGCIIGGSILFGALILKGQAGIANQAIETTASPAISKTVSAAPQSAKTETVEQAVAPVRRWEDPAAVAAANADTNSTVIGSEGEKNIRSGPGTKYSIEGSAYTGDRLKVLASSRDDGGYIWHKVYYPKSGVEGWVATQLMRVDAGTAAAAEMNKLVSASVVGNSNLAGRAIKPVVISPASEAAGKAAEAAKLAGGDASGDVATNATVTGSMGMKNLRSGAGTDYAVAFNLHTGDRVRVMGQANDRSGYSWYQVYSPQANSSAWIAAQLLKLD
jgi:serine/threonine protein kinase, bacterial